MFGFHIAMPNAPFSRSNQRYYNCEHRPCDLDYLSPSCESFRTNGPVCVIVLYFENWTGKSEPSNLPLPKFEIDRQIPTEL